MNDIESNLCIIDSRHVLIKKMRASEYVIAVLSVSAVAETASLSTRSLATNGGLTLVNPFWSIETTLKKPDNLPSAGMIASSNFPKLGILCTNQRSAWTYVDC